METKITDQDYREKSRILNFLNDIFWDELYDDRMIFEPVLMTQVGFNEEGVIKIDKGYTKLKRGVGFYRPSRLDFCNWLDSLKEEEIETLNDRVKSAFRGHCVRKILRDNEFPLAPSFFQN